MHSIDTNIKESIIHQLLKTCYYTVSFAKTHDVIHCQIFLLEVLSQRKLRHTLGVKWSASYKPLSVEALKLVIKELSCRHEIDLGSVSLC